MGEIDHLENIKEDFMVVWIMLIEYGNSNIRSEIINSFELEKNKCMRKPRLQRIMHA